MATSYEERAYISRDQLRWARGSVFVFGDNVERRGYGGQAKEMRGEPNAVGIVTKWRPSMQNNAFFRDSDFAQVKPLLDEAFERIGMHPGPAIWPSAGIGTGLADLERNAPTIFAYIRGFHESLKELPRRP